MSLCPICHDSYEEHFNICPKCRPLYENRAVNGTLPKQLLPYSAEITDWEYAALHRNDYAVGTGEITREACLRCGEVVIQEILERINNSNNAKPQPSEEEKHLQKVSAYITIYE